VKDLIGKYAAGTEVYALVDPNLKLVIRRYIDRVYYCRIPGKPEHKELVYFEREIRPLNESPSDHQ